VAMLVLGRPQGMWAARQKLHADLQATVSPERGLQHALFRQCFSWTIREHQPEAVCCRMQALHHF